MAADRVGRGCEKGIQRLNHLLGIAVGREFGEIGDIQNEHRRMANLRLQGLRLVYEPFGNGLRHETSKHVRNAFTRPPLRVLLNLGCNLGKEDPAGAKHRQRHDQGARQEETGFLDRLPLPMKSIERKTVS